MIVADTGAILALVDKGDRHHPAIRKLYEDRPDEWLLPWAILPEVDYLIASELGARAQDTFLADLADGAFTIEHGRQTRACCSCSATKVAPYSAVAAAQLKLRPTRRLLQRN